MFQGSLSYTACCLKTAVLHIFQVISLSKKDHSSLLLSHARSGSEQYNFNYYSISKLLIILYLLIICSFIYIFTDHYWYLLCSRFCINYCKQFRGHFICPQWSGSVVTRNIYIQIITKLSSGKFFNSHQFLFQCAYYFAMWPWHSTSLFILKSGLGFWSGNGIMWVLQPKPQETLKLPLSPSCNAILRSPCKDIRVT